MIIQDQFGTGLLNTDNVLGLGARANDEGADYVVVTIPTLSTEPNCILGGYATQERAEEVLYSIRNAITTGEPVYIMPKE